MGYQDKLQKATEIKRRRQSNTYVQLSQFQRLSNEEYFHITSPTNNKSSHHHNQIWKPSFSFHFTAISVIKRYFRKIKYFFIKEPTQTLPHWMPSTSTDQNSSILNFLTREDANWNDSSYSHSGLFGNVSNWFSYYWHRILSKKTPKESD